jgi:putative oxidoreductase
VPDLATLRLAWEPRVLSILRIMVGLLYFEHGLNKVFDFPHLDRRAPYVLMTLVPGLAGLLELIGGALLAAGIWTRAVAFILSGEMAVAYFMVYAPRSFFPLVNGGETATLYCFIFLYIFIAGGGVWSLDRLLARSASVGAAAGARN